ncbi:MAG: hypothetical protein KTR29_11655 [Rhodothermaceae bacterium]|nr:hypothetical protein [Rhodothermaceae bacterium]
MKFIESIRNGLDSLLGNYPEVVLYGEDLIDPYGGAFKVTKGLSTKYPDRVWNTPISEAAIIGMSAGMAMCKMKPIVEIMFGDFTSLGVDQLLNHLTKYAWMYNNQVETPVTIRTAMGGRRGYGPTHSQSLEALLSTIPGLSIIAPSHYHDPGRILQQAVLEDSSVKVFSEYKLLYPQELQTPNTVKSGLTLDVSSDVYPIAHLSNCEFDNPEILIISYGGNALLLEQVLLDLLIEYELSAQCALPARIKPFDPLQIQHLISEAQVVLVVEESPKCHGWGAEVVATLSEAGLLSGKNVFRIGSAETPIPSSMAQEEQVLPSAAQIMETISQILV